jgi:hypothetical protein
MSHSSQQRNGIRNHGSMLQSAVSMMMIMVVVDDDYKGHTIHNSWIACTSKLHGIRTHGSMLQSAASLNLSPSMVTPTIGSVLVEFMLMRVSRLTWRKRSARMWASFLIFLLYTHGVLTPMAVRTKGDKMWVEYISHTWGVRIIKKRGWVHANEGLEIDLLLKWQEYEESYQQYEKCVNKFERKWGGWVNTKSTLTTTKVPLGESVVVAFGHM